MSPSNQATISFTTPSVASTDQVVIRVSVSDAWWGISSMDVVLNVDASLTNSPPLADATGGGSYPEQTRFTLDGSVSTDPDGDIVSYQWTQTAGAPALSLSGAATATITSPVVWANDPLVPLPFAFTLRVTDSAGQWTEHVVNLDATPVNLPPQLDPIGPFSAVSGALVTVDWSTASADADGSIADYAWTVVSGTVPIDCAPGNSPSVSFTAPSGPQVLQLQLQLTDNEGATVSRTVDITIAG